MIHACPPTMPPSGLISLDRSSAHLFDSSASEQTLMSVGFQSPPMMNAFGFLVWVESGWKSLCIYI